jgi:hypothetical protein
MRAQVVLTPTEAKCFISKAIARMDAVKRAMTRGMVVIHPSSTTYFLVKELTGDVPGTDHWVLGGVFPQGLCRESGAQGQGKHAPPPPPPDREPGPKWSADMFPFKWVVKGGRLQAGTTLGKILEEIGPGDVYVKGCNALDAQGHAGVLFGHAGGGTIARVMGVQKEKGFSVILAVGLERLIPVSIAQAAKATARNEEFDYGMGMPCGLYPVKGGTTVTEVQAVEILSGARAVPIAAGGLGGAEGATVLAIEGDKEQVTRAIEYVEQSKGARLPQARPLPCYICTVEDCRFEVRDKPWSQRWA